LNLESTGIHLQPDPRRVLIRPFVPIKPGQISSIINRVLGLSEEETSRELARVRTEFGGKHPDSDELWFQQFERLQVYVEPKQAVSEIRRLLIGATFTGEYAFEAVALFNPSIVPHPDQSGVSKDELRFVLSLRGVGEGHISSLGFRTGVIRPDHSIQLEKISILARVPEVESNPTFPKRLFFERLNGSGIGDGWSGSMMKRLGDPFTLAELNEALPQVIPIQERVPEAFQRTMACVHWLAESNYEVRFHSSVPMSERVLFPLSANERNGLEDARFVRFIEPDKRATYYATYTAYDGRAILPQLIETDDFCSFRVRTLNGPAAQNKGMALFPRRIGGRYAMLSRQDDENILLMFSDDRHFWSDPKILLRPEQPWELVKLGNCGSPIETGAGWLVLTHGVGPLRKYCIGAALLGLEDPFRVLGRLTEPLLQPDEENWQGYVPNVVYSCGALIHNGRLVLPYANNDTSSKIVTIRLKDLIDKLLQR
jgi:predicted GH43/DUF377 family glycosyl hydrolase